MNVMFRHVLPMLELDLLKTFIAIAETGNFTTAAEAVYRTPSAVSMQVKKLEDSLGCTLFLRDARSVSLTPKGEVLLGFARRMLALNNEAVSRFLLPDMNGVVRLGVVDDVSEYILPDVLRSFSESYPNVMVDVRIGSSLAMCKLVDEHRLDIAIFDRSPSEPGGRDETLIREKLVWAGARCGTAHLREPLPISMWDEGCIWRAKAIEELQKVDRAYRVAFMSAHTSSQRSAARADLAVAPLGRYLVEGDLVVLGDAHNLPDLGYYEIAMRLISDPSPPIETLADHVRQAFCALGEKMGVDVCG